VWRLTSADGVEYDHELLMFFALESRKPLHINNTKSFNTLFLMLIKGHEHILTIDFTIMVGTLRDSMV